jgi:phage shock protein C
MPWMGHDAIMSDVNGKTLRRTHEGRIVAGVCSGLGQYFGVDANIIRVAFVLVSIFTGGIFGVLAYLAAWVVIPEEGEKSSIAENLVNKGRGS